MGELDGYFRVLGLRSDASWGQVSDAWRTLSKINHPDTQEIGSAAQKEAEELQKQLNLAYEGLKSYFNDGSARAALASCKNFNDFFNAAPDPCGRTSAYSAAYMDTEYQRATALADSASPNYDLLKAISILKSIANLGHGNAQFRLGHIYFDGIVKDLSQAAYWWQRAAESGNINAQFNLALLYERGMGLTKDQSKAILWFERAARNGDVEAASIVNKNRGRAGFLKKPNYWFRGI